MPEISREGAYYGRWNLYSTLYSGNDNATIDMAHKTAAELRNDLQKAEGLIGIGEEYFHYRHPDRYYTVIGLVVIEETDSVGVLYRADYEALQGIVFVRPIGSFREEVETDSGKTRRFSPRGQEQVCP